MAAALGPLREAARGGSEELLGHFTDLGDRVAQNALDAYLEHAADLLREIDAASSDLAARLEIAARSAESSTTVDPSVGRRRARNSELPDVGEAARKGLFT